MDGVILAAGRGSRLRHLTDELPKCLTTLMGKPLLEWQLEALGSVGLNQLTIVRGFNKEKIQPANVVCVDNHNWASTNMVYSLTHAIPTIKSPAFIVSYSDIAYPSDWVELLKDCDADLAITYDTDWYRLWEMRSENPLEDAETFRVNADGFVTEIGNSTSSVDEIQGQFMGLIRFTQKAWQWAEEIIGRLPEKEQRSLQMTQLLSLLIEAGYPIKGVPVEGRWVEVDTVEDKEVYEKTLAGMEPGTWHHDWRI
jgi:L-glutamine-phosphate cytidylyltransferase